MMKSDDLGSSGLHSRVDDEIGASKKIVFVFVLDYCKRGLWPAEGDFYEKKKFTASSLRSVDSDFDDS